MRAVRAGTNADGKCLTLVPDKGRAYGCSISSISAISRALNFLAGSAIRANGTIAKMCFRFYCRLDAGGTASRKAKEEGAVHRASPPRQHRNAPGSLLRAQTQGCRWVDGVTWQDYEVNLERNLEDPHGRVHRRASFIHGPTSASPSKTASGAGRQKHRRAHGQDRATKRD